MQVKIGNMIHAVCPRTNFVQEVNKMYQIHIKEKIATGSMPVISELSRCNLPQTVNKMYQIHKHEKSPAH
jgi:hypothetical protein